MTKQVPSNSLSIYEHNPALETLPQIKTRDAKDYPEHYTNPWAKCAMEDRHWLLDQVERLHGIVRALNLQLNEQRPPDEPPAPASKEQTHVCNCPSGSYHIKHTNQCYGAQIERLRREKAESDRCLNHYQARFSLITNAWRSGDNAAVLDAVRKHITAKDCEDADRLARASHEPPASRAIDLIANDAYAATFQTMAQYRRALLRELRSRAAPSEPPAESLHEWRESDWAFDFKFLEQIRASGPRDCFIPSLEGIECALLGYEQVTGRRLSETKSEAWPCPIGHVQDHPMCPHCAEIAQSRAADACMAKVRQHFAPPADPALCPHGMPLAENVCGPCSEGRPNRAATETSGRHPDWCDGAITSEGKLSDGEGQ